MHCSSSQTSAVQRRMRVLSSEFFFSLEITPEDVGPHKYLVVCSSIKDNPTCRAQTYNRLVKFSSHMLTNTVFNCLCDGENKFN